MATYYPYFRFTQRLERAQAFTYWYSYFKDKGTPLAIIREFIGNSKLQYSLWLVGYEWEIRNKGNLVAIKKNSILIQSDNDFLLKARLQVNENKVISNI